MNQEFNQEAAKGGVTTGGTTGDTCTKTGLYKANDGKIEFIEYIEVGEAFPPFPGGNGTKKCVWERLTKEVDGEKSSFTAVKVEAGAM